MSSEGAVIVFCSTVALFFGVVAGLTIAALTFPDASEAQQATPSALAPLSVIEDKERGNVCYFIYAGSGPALDCVEVW